LIFSAFGCAGSSGGSGAPGLVAPPTQNPNPKESTDRSSPKTDPEKKSVVFSGELKDSYGFNIDVSHDQAETLCERKGGTLPSVRDFAEFAISNGSVGIKPTAYPDGAASEIQNAEIKKMSDFGYDVIFRYSPIKKIVDFYFKNSGFKPLGYSRYWTLDRAPDNSPRPALQGASSYYYVFYNQNASFFPEAIDDAGEAIICAFRKN
jgi:hypothetical protein